jgi:hypothetical protein
VDRDGTVRYYDEDNKLHRDDGPALILPNGSQFWFCHGILHREDGPAREFDNGDEDYWLDGEQVTKEEHQRQQDHLRKSSLQRVSFDPEQFLAFKAFLIESIEDVAKGMEAGDSTFTDAFKQTLRTATSTGQLLDAFRKFADEELFFSFLDLWFKVED